MTVGFTKKPIDPATAQALLKCGSNGQTGSVLMHFAVVKIQDRDGRKTTGIEFRAAGEVEMELHGIADDLMSRWQLNDLVLLRRSGRVEIGEVISLIAATSANSQDVFEACQFGIECLKKMETISKKETYE